MAICPLIARIVLDREEELRQCLIEAPADEMRGADCKENPADSGAGTKA